MTNQENNSTYQFWKKPWHKWVILGVGLLQLWNLWLQLSEYREVYPNILTEATQEAYLAQFHFQCMVSVLMAVILLGTFVVGILVRNKKQEYLGTGFLLLGIAAGLAAAGGKLVFSQTGRIFWLVFLMISVGGGLWSLRKFLSLQV